MKDRHFGDVRLTEEFGSGTLVLKDGVMRLTKSGRTIAWFGRFFRTNLLPKHRLLIGTHTDVLTDPFRADEKKAP
jgi:hypothetical protein